MATETGQEANENEQGSQENVQENETHEQVETASESSQGIDWSAIKASDIPEEVLREHPAFKGVLTESIQRRQEIATLKQQLSQSSTDNSTGDQETTPDPIASKLTQLEDLMSRFIDMQVSRDTNDIRKQLATQYNVPESRVKYIAGNTAEELEASAKELGDVKDNVTGNTSPGNRRGGLDTSALKQRLKATVEDKGLDAPSIFDPGMQRVRGGGAVRT